ncbi:MAG: Succinate-semialdehyde dehydrogenase [NADP(+)] GabD [Phycisphaerae bacterium]|nr:Succinate-semialdehyde dehydrogenase [NADP(+)] GabD [Phycisphaerae bacterium]
MQTLNLLNGEWVAAESGETFTVTNPATDEPLADVPRCGALETTRAIASAQRAYTPWRKEPAATRERLLRQLAELMLRDREKLAQLMTREQGKPLAEARGEIDYAAGFIDWAAGEAPRLYGEMIPASSADKRLLVLRQPVGVTAAITPWNFPAAMITRKLGPALAAGCTMIIKPARQTPLTALAIGALTLEAGFPPGVVNLLTGDSTTITKALFDNPLVRKVSFTGSTEIGQLLIRQSAQHVTRLSLELGGHAPFIVFDDADLEAAITGAITTKYRNMGQTCICANRFFIHHSIHDTFVEMLQQAVSTLKVGPGWEEGVRIGPLIDDTAVIKVKDHIQDALNKGGKLCCGGSLVQPRDGLARRFFAPTIIQNMNREMLLFNEETFGPVAPIQAFRTEEEAVALANASPYGLAAYFYTRDASRLMRVAEALDYGIIGANDGAPSTPQAPFGGIKASGYGREGGRYVMHEYTDIKYVSWKL